MSYLPDLHKVRSGPGVSGVSNYKISNNKTQIPNGSTSSPPHHPEPSRRANHNDRNSKFQTIGVWSYLRFGYCNLEFACPVKRTITPYRRHLHLNLTGTGKFRFCFCHLDELHVFKTSSEKKSVFHLTLSLKYGEVTMEKPLKLCLLRSWQGCLPVGSWINFPLS